MFVHLHPSLSKDRNRAARFRQATLVAAATAVSWFLIHSFETATNAVEPNVRDQDLSALRQYAQNIDTAPNVARPEPATTVAADPEFAGSEKCATCHKQEFDSWKQTLHARMVLTRNEGLLKDAAENWTSDGKNPGPTKGNIDGQPYTMEDVVFVVGTKWKQRFLVTNPATGNHQFLDKQWNAFSKQWEPYGQKNDWETQCTTCHTTGYRIIAYDPNNTAAMKITMVERNIGCEACHGPGLKHIASAQKADIFNSNNVTKAEASKVCGYCHVRLENYSFRTAQNNPSEQLPHPEIGQTYRAGRDDWTQWYSDKVLMPGVHAEDALTAENRGTDLANAFWLDQQSTASGLYDTRKHHQQYQEFIQSKHFTGNAVSCSDCHMPHAISGRMVIQASATCTNCHGNQYDWQTIMPGTGQTAQQLFVRTHTFNPKQARPGGMTADRLAPPSFFYAPK
jgi:nitrate/TMAO reductase-like tetraheme cytochrome c subunit